jgi:hypothetical protein
MLRVNLWDVEFEHSVGEQGFDAASYRFKPNKIEYVRNQTEWDGITLFTNRCLDKALTVKSKIKIAWMHEARIILPGTYERLLELEDTFDYIVTYYEDLLQRNPKKYIPYISGCCRIPPNEQQVYPKTKLLSHLVTRQTTTYAHQFRHILAHYLHEMNFPVTIFGPNHTPYPTKLDAHKDFMFSIVIMNSCENFYFSEWLIDCFMCGTIPIFYGCPDIGRFFNQDGIIQIKELNDVLAILPSLTPELYESKKEAIYENLQKAKAFVCPDDLVAAILQREVVPTL